MIHPAFRLLKTSTLKELRAQFLHLEHIQSQAKVFHIACDDPENLFCLSFKTVPHDSKGAAHILEHVVLCGSERYPVKDPFFAMTRRSLNTFMNALTGADFTCYPAATQVEKDFYNLLDVYLDAVFHPRIRKESFLQEGWRLELADPHDVSGPVVWKGVVFNEMKGAMASPDSRLWQALGAALMPELTYAYVSGGDPRDIPTLTYDELVRFYATHYHPSRCSFFFYGNLPLAKHLEVLHEQLLKNVTPTAPSEPMPRQTRFLAPKTVHARYSHTDTRPNQLMVAWSWLTVFATDQEETLALALVDAIMMGHDGSPLKKAILNSGLCTTVDSAMDLEMSEVPYVIVCKECSEEGIEQLEKVILATLEESAERGIPAAWIESALYQLEIAKTEIDSSQAPFGLSLFFRACLTEQHGGDGEKALSVHQAFKALRLRLQDPEFLPSFIRRVLTRNPHRVRVVLTPSSTLLQEEEKEEQQRLETLGGLLSQDQRKEIQDTMHRLQTLREQELDQDISCLPTVTLRDVPPTARFIPLNKNGELLHHTAVTNGLVYADWIMDLPHVTPDDLPWVQLLVSLMPELGVGKRSYSENLELWQGHVGSMAALVALFPNFRDPKQVNPALILRSKALEPQAPRMLELMHEWALGVRLDEKDRIVDLIHQIHAQLQHRVVPRALKYASGLACSGLSPGGYLSEQWHGVSYHHWIQRVVQSLPTHVDEVVSQLACIKYKLLSFHRPQLVVTCGEQAVSSLPWKPLLEVAPISQRPWEEISLWPKVTSQARSIPSPVAFTCQAMNVCSYSDPQAPALTLASQLMDHLVLHPKIREEGGAYGAGTTYAPVLGHFTFHTFRDPVIASSVQAFQEAVDTVAAADFSEDDLGSAKLEAIQALDAPVSPGARGMLAYTWLREGRSYECRQQYRERLLHMTSQEVAVAVQDQLQRTPHTPTLVTVAGADLLERENKKLAQPLPIIPI